MNLRRQASIARLQLLPVGEGLSELEPIFQDRTDDRAAMARRSICSIFAIYQS
jgi:hypothetical protein